MNATRLETPLEKAIAVAGSKYRLAKLIGIKPPSVHAWMRSGRIPAERVLAVEAATGISRYELRPDIYPAEDHQQAA